MQLKPGSRWKSAVCTAEAVVVRPAPGDHVLECGGTPMLAPGETAPDGAAPAADKAGGVAVGKRYFDAETLFEILCAKPGKGTFSLDGRVLELKEAKALPSSD